MICRNFGSTKTLKMIGAERSRACKAVARLASRELSTITSVAGMRGRLVLKRYRRRWRWTPPCAQPRSVGFRVRGVDRRADLAPDTRQVIPTSALRFKLFKRKQGRLFIFAIDLSGSMALNRIGHAKGVMHALLRESYIKRDSVAIVGFRGTSAELLLPPSRSILRARRVLDSVGVGGGTPLSAGLTCALELASGVPQLRVAATLRCYSSPMATRMSRFGRVE